MTKYRLVKGWEKVGKEDQYSYLEGKTPDLDGGGWPEVYGDRGMAGEMYGHPLRLAKLLHLRRYNCKPPYIRRKR